MRVARSVYVVLLLFQKYHLRLNALHVFVVECDYVFQFGAHALLGILDFGAVFVLLFAWNDALRADEAVIIEALLLALLVVMRGTHYLFAMDHTGVVESVVQVVEGLLLGLEAGRVTAVVEKGVVVWGVELGGVEVGVLGGSALLGLVWTLLGVAAVVLLQIQTLL